MLTKLLNIYLFFLFLRFHLLQGPIGLDGPKGEPVSFLIPPILRN